MRTDADIERVVADALADAAAGKPVLVDVHIDYSKRTRFTEGVIRTNLKRFGLQGPGAAHRPRVVAQGDGLISRRPARNRRPPP